MPALSRVANTLRASQVIVSVLWLGLLFGLLGAPAAYAVPNPTITGPIPAPALPGDPSHNYPFLATILIPPVSDYIEQEFFMEGTANRYSTSCAVLACPPELSLSRGTVVSSGNPYKVRMVVRRPSDPSKFNGRVIVEWLNVTNNFELDVQWYRASEYFIRQGYAYVGVGPQRAGIHEAPNGLRAWSPSRYGTLDVTVGGTVTDNSLKWDIFSQAGQAIAKPVGVDPLGSLPGPRLLIATGDSQSSGNLATYLNAVHPLDPIYSGFVLGGPIGIPIRSDVGVKVFKVISEWELVVFEAAIRQPDTAQYVAWEVAGSSHSDYHNFVVNSPVRLRDVGTPGILPDATNCIDPARSRVHLYLVHQAAYDRMARWLLRGKQPPRCLSRSRLISPSRRTRPGLFVTASASRSEASVSRMSRCPSRSTTAGTPAVGRRPRTRLANRPGHTSHSTIPRWTPCTRRTETMLSRWSR